MRNKEPWEQDPDAWKREEAEPPPYVLQIQRATEAIQRATEAIQRATEAIQRLHDAILLWQLIHGTNLEEEE